MLPSPAREIEFITEHSPSVVALQFSDTLLGQASRISDQIPVKTFILGDTTFGSCCIDTIAASHINCDLLIHYGQACMSTPVCTYPILYVFDNLPVNVPHLVNSMDSIEGYVLVLFDTSYHHIIPQFKAALESHPLLQSIIWSKMDTELNTPTSIERGNMTQFRGRYYTLPSGIPIEDISILFIGPSSLLLTQISMAFYSAKRIMYFDPALYIGVNGPEGDDGLDGLKEAGVADKLFRRRYALVQKAKDAQVIGIVVGTLGVASYLGVIENLKKLVLASGKKPYLLAVGKPNPAKLANFLEIDVFCLVSCPENAMIDSKEYLKPIVTPYELSLALDPGSGWDVMKYELDLKKLESSLADSIIDAELNNNDEDEPHFSLATGKFIQKSRMATRVIEVEEAGETALLPRGEAVISKYVVTSAAAKYLSERTYQGLEAKVGETPVVDVEEGRGGIARGYTHETQ